MVVFLWLFFKGWFVGWVPRGPFTVSLRGGFPDYCRLQKKVGALLLTSLLEDLVGFPMGSKCVVTSQPKR